MQIEKLKVAEVGSMVGAIALGAVHIGLRLQRDPDGLSRAVDTLQKGMQFAGQIANNFCTATGAELAESVSLGELVQ
ncbi:hypothetical protein B5E65_05415 [Gemmiger sp. An120]|uniref:hypothetical protein n=1 Tax=Gemmiger sp. An120 TaxID=1965549 RepID=UPI000B3948FD|nr:hypothetical protein [Gemmiger sp. An120]OUQ43213.1 hypothetical protein B5E65_05415 [Gemmiger sp. An120]